MSEWQQVTLHEVCSFKRGLSYSGSDVKEDTPSGIPFITIKNFHKGGGFNFSGFKKYIGKNHADFTVSPGDLLIANTDVTRNADIIGSAIIAPEVDGDIAFSMDVTHLDVDKNKASPAFVCYRLLLDDAREHMKGASAGSTVLHLNLKQASAFPFKIPTKSEQKVIARILDTLDTQIQKTEALIAKLEKVKEGLLHDLLTRGIDENGQLRPSPEQAPELYKESPLGLIPREWACVAIGETATSTTLGTANRGADSAGKTKLIKMGNLDWGNTLSILDVESISASKVQDGLFLNDADLLFNTRNTPELVGKTCSWKGDGSLFTFDNNILRLRFSENLNGHFVASYMGGAIGRRRIGRLATGTTSVAAIYWRSLSRMELPMPSPDEQQLIVDKIDSSQKNINALNDGLTSLQRLKVGLMDDLLTGRIRVTPLLKQTQATTPA
ncbi:type I restriction enzyme S subunit [Thioalkalivibrio sp. ALE21]|uniref:restriction endonuclease subunit S n=1 Tax=Thioalkalivibrio sp. ALE21 TaxID=1158175 RepID=UPI000D95FC12|nr:restriction endonuclease subunit S [Thioalkalivibrio sp. ALE21]PYG04009.1 type I restriction enzyme S subunit [Thioalkalivibrio sp. ALE21]